MGTWTINSTPIGIYNNNNSACRNICQTRGHCPQAAKYYWAHCRSQFFSQSVHPSSPVHSGKTIVNGHNGTRTQPLHYYIIRFSLYPYSRSCPISIPDVPLVSLLAVCMHTYMYDNGWEVSALLY